MNGLPIGTVIDATSIVDEQGAVLWEGAGPRRRGRAPGTILATDRLVDDPAERRRLHERDRRRRGRHGERGPRGDRPPARRASARSATPRTRPLGPLAKARHARRRPRPLGFLKRACVREPAATLRALGDVRRALTALAKVRV